MRAAPEKSKPNFSWIIKTSHPSLIYTIAMNPHRPWPLRQASSDLPAVPRNDNLSHSLMLAERQHLNGV
jgi:hypothetical protein